MQSAAGHTTALLYSDWRILFGLIYNVLYILSLRVVDHLNNRLIKTSWGPNIIRDLFSWYDLISSRHML